MHDASEQLHVRMRGERKTGKFDMPLPINAIEPVSVNTDVFRGHVLFLHALTPPAEGTHPYGEHFAHRKRRLEIRLQGVFTQKPDEVFFAVELTQVVRPGMLSAYAVKCVLAFVSAINKMKDTGFSYNIDPIVKPDGDSEGQHFVWPLQSADAVVGTPIGESPPDITDFIEDTPPSEKRKIKLDQGHVWTFVWHTMYVDLLSWEVCNILGLSQALDGFIGHQEILLSYYRLKEKPHERDGTGRSAPEAGRECESGCLAHGDRNRLIFMQLALVPERAMKEQPALAAPDSQLAKYQGEPEAQQPSEGETEQEGLSFWGSWAALLLAEGGGCCAARAPIIPVALPAALGPPPQTEVAAQEWEQLFSKDAASATAPTKDYVEPCPAPRPKFSNRVAGWLSGSGRARSSSAGARRSSDDAKPQ